MISARLARANKAVPMSICPALCSCIMHGGHECRRGSRVQTRQHHDHGGSRVQTRQRMREGLCMRSAAVMLGYQALGAWGTRHWGHGAPGTGGMGHLVPWSVAQLGDHRDGPRQHHEECGEDMAPSVQDPEDKPAARHK